MRRIVAIIGLGLLTGAGVIFLSGTPAGDSVSMDNDTTFTLTSAAFEDGGAIPTRYTCDGERAVTPPLSIANVPEGTHSMVLVMDDPDIPQVFKDERGIQAFDHWVVYDIPPSIAEIPEGGVVGSSGVNSGNNEGYTGPCPPPEYQPTTHRYIFTMYALSGSVQFAKAPTKAEVLAAIQGMILAEATLIGTYDRAGTTTN